MSSRREVDRPPRDFTVVRRGIAPRQPRLSVVVPSYNTAPFVRDTLASLFAQTVRDLEVIVVDDGSVDDSMAVLAAVSEERLTVVHQANRGLAGSRNTGIGLSRAAAIGFCDADDVWRRDKAERHLALLAAEPSAGLTYSHSAYLAEDGSPSGQLLLSRCRQPSALDLIRRNHVGNGSTVVARTEVFRRAGVFDETLGSCEDFEMWVRAAARSGFAVRLIPEVLTGYRVRAGSMSTTYEPFLRGYARALERFRDYVPGFGAAQARRSWAECLRIASRKAFSSGEVALSRRLLIDAIRSAPALPLRDPRAFGMVLLHLLALPLGERRQRSLYRGVRALMKQGFRCVAGSSSDLTPLPPGEARVRG